MSFAPLVDACVSADRALFEPARDASEHYLQHHQQFQLHALLTEQRHKKTWRLEQEANTDTEVALRSLFSVDEDITAMLQNITNSVPHASVDPLMPACPETSWFNLQAMSSAVTSAILNHNKVYVYGCGATGRLAKQMESTFWRPFWTNIQHKHSSIWAKIQAQIGSDIADRCIGEMTGADRALISSLEGFEDLQLIGRLQLKQHNIQKGDTVICVTEGGETSSVIGTILGAFEQYDTADLSSAQRLFFVYNNPDAVLLPLDRSRSVLQCGGISKINLATGPQAITGSTRMQATSSETFAVACCFHVGIAAALSACSLSDDELAQLGFRSRVDADAGSIQTALSRKLNDFAYIQSCVSASAGDIGRFTRTESECYTKSGRSTYYSTEGLMTVFIDNTERSPTFRLLPLDTVSLEQRQCWLQVWTDAQTFEQSWDNLLHRSFVGLPKEMYADSFNTQITDPYLKGAADRSLKNAGNEQQQLYDFSFGGRNVAVRGPANSDDLGVMVLMAHEVDQYLSHANQRCEEFVGLFANKAATTVALLVTPHSASHVQQQLAGQPVQAAVVCIDEGDDDPLHIRHQIALKMVLNAHSTAVMCRMGRVCYNTMTNVSPSNLKLIGRATYLSLSHITDMIRLAKLPYEVVYADVNRMLHLSIAFIRQHHENERARVEAGGVPNPNVHQISEVAVCIIATLELASSNAQPTAIFSHALNVLLNDCNGSLSVFLNRFESGRASDSQ